jgi:phosphoadenosine phosphosulfate reductase
VRNLLGQLNIEGKDKVEVAIDRLKMFEPAEGYYLAFSGGKDSVVIKALADMAGVKYDAHYNLTTVDPPELVQFIKSFNDVIIDYPEKTMWQLIVEKRMPPTRIVRYCCSELKEHGGDGRFVVTGVRWAESVKRKKNRQLVEFDRYGSSSKKAKDQREIFLNSDNDEKRKMLETCVIKGKHILNPIVDWSDSEVWEFIHQFRIPYCKLYDEGFKRLGCIGCPMGGSKRMKVEFERYPKYYHNYLKAFDRMLKARRDDGLDTDKWETALDVMNWWMSDY